MNLFGDYSFNGKAILAILVFFFSFSFQSFSQDELPEIYVEIACFDFKEPGADKFFVEKAKPFHEELIRQGILINWSLMRVDFPNGDNCECNRREVRVFNDPKSIDFLSSQENMMKIASKVFPDENMQEMMAEFRRLVDFKESQIFLLRDDLIPGPSEGKLFVLNFMDVKPSKGFAYTKMERDEYKPVHMASYKAGNLLDWNLWQRILPFGSGEGAEYITVDVYDSYEHMMSQDNFMEVWNSVHPEIRPWQLSEKMNEIRDLVRAEILFYVARAEVPEAERPAANKDGEK